MVRRILVIVRGLWALYTCSPLALRLIRHRVFLLGGSWDLVSTYNWTYNRLIVGSLCKES